MSVTVCRMYSYEIRDSLDKVFFKLAKKDKALLKIIDRKIIEIIREPDHYKNLRKPLQHLKRVHIGKSHVLCFSVDENRKVVLFEKFGHHDKIYL